MQKILAFLAMFNCYPNTIINPSNATFFLDGVVYIRPDMITAPVIAHELVHACDYEKWGPAKTRREWIERERHAIYIERAFLYEHENENLDYGPLSEQPMALPAVVISKPRKTEARED